MNDSELKKNQDNMQVNKFTWLDYLLILVKWRKFLILNILFFGIIAAIFSLIMPKTYTATAILMPPTQTGKLFSNLSLNLPAFNVGGIFGGIPEEINNIMAILNSRTLAESTIKKFNLMERYQSKTIEHALITFRSNVSFSLEKEGTIKIEAYTHTGYFHPQEEENKARELAAAIVNYMAAKADSMNTQLQTQRAKFNRIFLEKRYEENKQELRKLEEQLKEFGEKYGIISLPDQLIATIQSAASLESEIIIKEVKLEVLKKMLNPDNPEIRKKIIEVNQLKRKLTELINGNRLNEAGAKSIMIFPGFREAPELGMKYLRLKRELEVQNILYEFLTQQYEQAKIQEAKDTPSLQVLDPAQPPILRSKPKRKLFLLFVLLVIFVLSLIYIYIMEYIENLKLNDYEKYQKILQIIAGLNIFKKVSGAESK